MIIYYKEYGNPHGPLMVFIHGGGVSGWMWDKQIKHFTNFHCLVPDMPEHGQSRNDYPFSIHTSAKKILELIEQKQKQEQGNPVIAIGFSLGAQVLIAMLSMKPNLIQYAMINSALVKPLPFAKMIINSLGLVHPLTRNKTFSKIQAQTMYIDEAFYEIYYDENRRMSKDALTRILNENMSFTIPQSFAQASGNLLVTVGAKEKKIMKASMTEIIKSNPKCKGVLFPNIGHGACLADPARFNILIEQWIQHDTLPLPIDESKSINFL